MTITLEWWQWILPAIIAAAVVGFIKGWRIMGLWTIGVFFSGIVASRLGPNIDKFLTKFLSIGGQFAAIASNKDESTVSTPTIQIASPWEPLATALLFIGLLMLSWWVSRKLAGGGEMGLLGHLLGAAFGALASIIGLSQAFDYWTDFVNRSGNGVPGGQVVVPQISVGVGALPTSNPLMGLATISIGLFLLLIILYTIWRAVRAT